MLIINFLKDRCKLYRRIRGGRWAKWTGMWEQSDSDGYVLYRRGFLGVNIMEGKRVWYWDQWLPFDAEAISDREDYTNHAV